MNNEVTYPEGIRAFNPHEKSPSFVKASIVITPNDLFKWLKENESLLTEYEGKKQIKLQLLDGKKGLYLKVDDYKAKSKQSVEAKDDLPF
jgi:hypothetical protein